MTYKVARDYPWGGERIFIILITNLIGIQYFLLCPLFFLSETTDPFHFQILQPLLPFSKSCNPHSVLKILQPPFRSQNPAAPLPFSKSCSPPSVLKILQPSFRSQNPTTPLPFTKILQPPPVLKILRPPFPPQNPATSAFPRVLLLQFLQDVPFFPFPFYLLFLHCQLGASSFGETLEQFLTRLKNKYHWTDQGRLEALMKELRKRRITTVRTLQSNIGRY